VGGVLLISLCIYIYKLSSQPNPPPPVLAESVAIVDDLGGGGGGFFMVFAKSGGSGGGPRGKFVTSRPAQKWQTTRYTVLFRGSGGGGGPRGKFVTSAVRSELGSCPIRLWPTRKWPVRRPPPRICWLGRAQSAYIFTTWRPSLAFVGFVGMEHEKSSQTGTSSRELRRP
jgi:hypothetical protein